MRNTSFVHMAIFVFICSLRVLYFLCPTTQALYNKIKNGVFYFKSHAWKDISPTAMDLVKKLLDGSQLRRLTVQQALAHPWFSMAEGECICVISWCARCLV